MIKAEHGVACFDQDTVTASVLPAGPDPVEEKIKYTHYSKKTIMENGTDGFAWVTLEVIAIKNGTEGFAWVMVELLILRRCSVVRAQTSR